MGERRHLVAHVQIPRVSRLRQLYIFFLTPVASGTGRRARGWTTSTTETPVTPASRPWSTSTATTALCCSPQQVRHARITCRDDDLFFVLFLFIYFEHVNNNNKKDKINRKKDKVKQTTKETAMVLRKKYKLIQSYLLAQIYSSV